MAAYTRQRSLKLLGGLLKTQDTETRIVSGELHNLLANTISHVTSLMPQVWLWWGQLGELPAGFGAQGVLCQGLCPFPHVRVP